MSPTCRDRAVCVRERVRQQLTTLTLKTHFPIGWRTEVSLRADTVVATGALHFYRQVDLQAALVIDVSFNRGFDSLKKSLTASASRCIKIIGKWKISSTDINIRRAKRFMQTLFNAISVDRLSKGAVIGKEGRFAIDSMQMSIEFTSV